MSAIVVLCDKRENPKFVNILTQHIQELNGYLQKHRLSFPYAGSIIFKNQVLKTADIIIQGHDGFSLCIERKTYSDMAASIKDGRSHEQMHRLNALKSPTTQVAYLFEKNRATKFPLATIRQAMTNKQQRDGMQIIKTDSMLDSANEICRILKCKCKYGFPVRQQQSSTLSKETHVEAQYIKSSHTKAGGVSTVTNMLSTIDRVSPKMASAITTQHPTMAVLMKHLVLNGPSSLVGIQIPGRTAKIGPVTSKKIYNALLWVCHGLPDAIF